MCKLTIEKSEKMKDLGYLRLYSTSQSIEWVGENEKNSLKLHEEAIWGKILVAIDECIQQMREGACGLGWKKGLLYSHPKPQALYFTKYDGCS